MLAADREDRAMAKLKLRIKYGVEKVLAACQTTQHVG